MLRIEEIVGAMDDEFRYALDALDSDRLKDLAEDKAALRRLRPVGVSHAEAVAMIQAILERRARPKPPPKPRKPRRKAAKPPPEPTAPAPRPAEPARLAPPPALPFLPPPPPGRPIRLGPPAPPEVVIAMPGPVEPADAAKAPKSGHAWVALALIVMIVLIFLL